MYDIFNHKINQFLELSFMVSQTIYFTGVMVFILTSQMYYGISVLAPVLVRVPEYVSTSTSISTITLELTHMSKVQVAEIQYLSTASTSTSTLALVVTPSPPDTDHPNSVLIRLLFQLPKCPWPMTTLLLQWGKLVLALMPMWVHSKPGE